MINDKVFNDTKMPYIDILNESMDSIADDLIEAYEEGDLGKGLATLGIHSNEVANVCSREALKCIMKVVCSQYSGFNNFDKLKEVSDRKISSSWSEAFLKECRDDKTSRIEMEFFNAIENAIKGRMRWKAIEKVDNDIEDMWKPKED